MCHLRKSSYQSQKINIMSHFTGQKSETKMNQMQISKPKLEQDLIILFYFILPHLFIAVSLVCANSLCL